MFELRIRDQISQPFSSLDAIQAYVDALPGIDPRITVVKTDQCEGETFMSVSLDLTYQQVAQAFQSAQVRIENKLKQLPENRFVEEVITFSA